MRRITIQLEKNESGSRSKSVIVSPAEEISVSVLLEKIEATFSVDHVDLPLFTFTRETATDRTSAELRTREEINLLLGPDRDNESADAFLKGDTDTLRIGHPGYSGVWVEPTQEKLVT